MTVEVLIFNRILPLLNNKMIKFIILFLGLSYLCHGQNSLEIDSLVLWQKTRPLKWEDFKGDGKQPKDIHLIHKVAETTPIIKTAYIKNENGVKKEVLLCYFSKNESWTITRDMKTLEHEQIHFDILEVFTRRIRKQHQKLDSLGITDLDEYDLYTNRLIMESVEFNNKYDEEVLLNYPKQQEWRKCIDKELEDLKEYEFIPEQ